MDFPKVSSTETLLHARSSSTGSTAFPGCPGEWAIPGFKVPLRVPVWDTQGSPQVPLLIKPRLVSSWEMMLLVETLALL